MDGSSLIKLRKGKENEKTIKIIVTKDEQFSIQMYYKKLQW